MSSISIHSLYASRIFISGMQKADTKVGLPTPCSFVALTLNKCLASIRSKPSSSLPDEKSRPVQSIKGTDALFCIILDVDDTG